MKKVLFLALSVLALTGCDSKLKSAQKYIPMESTRTAQEVLESFFVQGEWTEDKETHEVVFAGYTQKYLDLMAKLNRELPSTLKLAEQSWKKVELDLSAKIAGASGEDKAFYQRLATLGSATIVEEFFRTEYKRIAHEILDTNKIKVVFHVDDAGNVGIVQGERMMKRSIACVDMASTKNRMPIVPKCMDEEMKIKREKGDRLVDAIRGVNTVAGSFHENYDRFVYAAVGLDDPRDGSHYRAVSIGNQVWMAENLRYGKLTDDELVNLGIWNGSTGRYNYEKAVSICPEEWHLPSEKEWNELLSYAKVMKNKGSVTKSLIAGDWYNSSLEKLNASAGFGEDVTTDKGRKTLIRKNLLLEGENLWGFSALAENQSSFEFSFCEKYQSTACPDPSVAYYWVDGGKMFMIKGNAVIPTIATKKNTVAAVRCVLNDASYRNVARIKAEVSPVLREYVNKQKEYFDANDSLGTWENVGFSATETNLVSFEEVAVPKKMRGIKMIFKAPVGSCTEHDVISWIGKAKKGHKIISDGECEYYGDCKTQAYSIYEGVSLDAKSASKECATFVKEANLI